MLGKRAIRSGLTAGRGADAASTPARPEAHPQPRPQFGLATVGVAAIDILPADGGRGLRRRRATSSTALATSVAVASPVAELAAPAGLRRSVEPVFADAADSQHVVDGPSFARRPSADPGSLEPALVAVGPLAGASAEVPSLFAAPLVLAATPASAAEAADVPTEPIGLAGPLTASGDEVAARAVPADVEPAADSVAAVALAAQDVVEPAPSSLFAPAPSVIVPVAEIVPAGVTSVVAAAEVAQLFAPAPAGTASGPEAPAAPSLRERSAMASEALSELSALSSYRPDGQSGTSAPAARRAVPAAGAAGQPAAQGEESLGARRGTRNAADVRSMLSGFRAGGERGRASAAAGALVPEQAPAPEQA